MDRKVFVFKTHNGYLSDIDHYTHDATRAVSFVDLDSAVTRLAAVSGVINQPISIEEVSLPFPLPFPKQI
jgi:hypothetical protein